MTILPIKPDPKAMDRVLRLHKARESRKSVNAKTVVLAYCEAPEKEPGTRTQRGAPVTPEQQYALELWKLISGALTTVAVAVVAGVPGVLAWLASRRNSKALSNVAKLVNGHTTALQDQAEKQTAEIKTLNEAVASAIASKNT